MVEGGDVVVKVGIDRERDEGGFRAKEVRSQARWEEDKARERGEEAARKAVEAAEGSKRALEVLGDASLRVGGSGGVGLVNVPPGLGQGGGDRWPKLREQQRQWQQQV